METTRPRERLQRLDAAADKPAMSALSLSSAIINVKTAESLGQIQLAVAARMLKTANDQGKAVVALIESAAETMEQATAQVLNAVGSSLDLVG